MKKLIFGILLAMLAVPATMVAQNTLSANASASVVIPITIVDISGLTGGTTLNFGAVALDFANSGTVTVSTQNVRTVGGSITAVASTGTSTASFGVTGTAGKTYAITLPADGTISVVSTTNPANTMAVNQFLARPASAGADQLTGTIGVGGSDSFTVGATLTVAAGQAEGIYNGSFSVTANYN